VLPSVVQADAAEDRAVQAIKKPGGEITRDEKADGKPIVGVGLHGFEVTDAGLKRVGRLPPTPEVGPQWDQGD